MASGGIEYGCPSWMTTPIGLTPIGIRSARSAGAIRNGRNRARSSTIRSAGGTPVARDGRTVFASVSQVLQIGPIEEAPLLEERAFHPADQILDAPFLLRSIGPAHFHAEAEIERHAGKGGIPLGDHAIATPLERHRLRPIEDRHQRNAAEGGDVIHQRAHQGLDLLVGHHRHLGPAGVLQTRGKEVHDLLRLVLIAHAHFAEIVLREFARQPFESDQRRHDARTQCLRQGIDRALPAGVPGLPCPMEQFHRPDRGLLGQRLHEHRAIRLRPRGAPDLPARPLRRVIDRRDRAFRGDAPHGPHGHAAQGGDLLPRVPRPPKHLHLVSLEHLDHPFPRRRWNLRRLSGPVGLPAGGQNFRKGGGQNCRNPQA